MCRTDPQRGPRWPVRPSIALFAALFLPGCATPGRMPAREDASAASAAAPILTLDPNAVWTAAYNHLVELGPASIAYLMRQPALTQPAAPDNLAVLLHTSLVRLLANPATSPPPLSATCLETTLGMVYFDLKVQGRRLGTVVWPQSARFTTWPALYPARFDHAAAAGVDLEADRQALRAWWAAQQANPAAAVANRRLEPQNRHLWRLLARRYVDRWEYAPESTIVLCGAPPRGPALLELSTEDYNLVRAACIWLGSLPERAVQDRLIELVGSPLPIVAHNARFALRFSPDPRIRAVLERYEARGQERD